MQQQDQSEKIETTENTKSISEEAPLTSATEQFIVASEEVQLAVESSFSTREQALDQPQRWRFDWPALLAALGVAAFFALTARFNSQPSPSYIPAAVFSATGCGLLVTAIHKLRGRHGAGLLEAGLSGFGMALLQFAVAFTYPSVFTTVTTIPDYGRAFLITWGLIALFAVILSLAGATIGHLAFAPLRPLPARAQKQQDEAEEEDEDEDETENTLLAQSTTGEDEAESTLPAETTEGEEQTDEIEEEEENAGIAAAVTQPQRSLLNYAITVLLLGLLPMMAGYVFAAIYDFAMNAINVNAISPGLYPTLSLLSGLLPWRLAAPITLSGTNGAFIVFTLLWRIPDSVLGNPNLFDVQALEALVFNAVGLALLLITMYRSDARGTRRQPAPWGIFLFLEALAGLILILPANLWLLRGLEGVLQLGSLVAKLPTIQLISPVLFVLNLLTGALLCLIIGLVVRRQYQLWTAPRAKTSEVQEEEN